MLFVLFFPSVDIKLERRFLSRRHMRMILSSVSKTRLRAVDVFGACFKNCAVSNDEEVTAFNTKGCNAAMHASTPFIACM